MVRFVPTRPSGENRDFADCKPIRARCNGTNRNATADPVAGLFFPPSGQWKLDFTSFSPRLLQRMIYAGSQSPSFAQASRNLWHLHDCRVDPKQIERQTHTIGEERIDERHAAREVWGKRTLMERTEVAPEALSPECHRDPRIGRCFWAAVGECGSPTALSRGATESLCRRWFVSE